MDDEQFRAQTTRPSTFEDQAWNLPGWMVVEQKYI